MYRALLFMILVASGRPALGATPTLGGSASAQPLPRGELITRVQANGSAEHSYALYLPADYSPQRQWPVLIILDPRGRAEASLRLALDGAREHGWIVLSSHDSRSDGLESITIFALQALLDESQQRFSADPRRLYLAGMSGTAKSMWKVVDPLAGMLAGLVGCAGGRPPELGAIRRKPPAFYGCTGTVDFNYQEMQALDSQLQEAGAVRRLDIFAGGHGWPGEGLGPALDWLELMAMRDGLTPRNEAFIQAQFQAALSNARSQVDALERWRMLHQLVRDFSGLRDVAVQRAEADRLAEDRQVRQMLALEKRLRADERRHAQLVDAWADSMSGAMLEGRRQSPPGLAQSLFQLKVATLRKLALDADPRVAASARRRLERIHVAASFYIPAEATRRGEPEIAAMARKLAAEIFPGRAPMP